MAVETAFRELYDQVGGALYALLKSKDPKEKQLGMILVHLEYENLMTTLKLALNAQVSILNIYSALSNYLDTTQDHTRGLNLGMTVLKCLEIYPSDKLEGQLAVEFVHVVDSIARRQLMLKQYTAAEASYQKALDLHLSIKDFGEETSKKLSASIYHQLGRVTQEQGRWEQAEQYYQQALQIKIEYNDRYSQASTYHQLGVVAQEQGRWEQAEQYYQQALQIYIEYNDRYEQAGTYHQLGTMAREQSKWKQAQEYLLQALQILAEYQDAHYVGVTLRNLARLWQASGDATLPAAIASVIGGTPEEVEALLREMLEGSDEETSSNQAD